MKRLYPGLGFLLLATTAVVGFQRPSTPTPARQLADKYCISCHNQRSKVGGLALDSVDADHPATDAQTWEKVIAKLRSRAMPPPNAPRPDNASYDAVADWLESEIDREASVRIDRRPSAGLHRLNRTEYANSVFDLLAVEVDAQALLPPDEQAFGFENNAEALSIDPALLDRYVNAATTIARLAVGDPDIPPAFVRYGALKNNANDITYLRQTERLGEDFPLGSKGGVAARHYFPVDGEYVLRLRLQRSYEGSIRGLNVSNQFEIRIDGRRVAQFTLGGEGSPSPAFQYDGDEVLQARVPVTAGLRQVTATILKTDNVAPEGGGPDRLSHYSRDSDKASSPVAIASLHIGGPYNGLIPRDSPSRKLVFVCSPARVADELPCATRILSTLARRAYRRAVTDNDVQTLLAFYNRTRKAGSFDDGIRSAVERVLVSPDFLFRIELDPRGSCFRQRLSGVRRRARLAIVVRFVEQHSRRDAAQSRYSGQTPRTGCVRRAGSANGRPIPARESHWSRISFPRGCRFVTSGCSIPTVPSFPGSTTISAARS